MPFETDCDFLNAKLHGMRSTLIEGNRLIVALDKTEGEITTEYVPKTLDSSISQNRLLLERVLLERDIFVFEKINKYLSKDDRIVIELFYENLYLGNLKIIFKFWHHKYEEDISEFIVHIPRKKSPDIERLLSAESISEFAKFIDDPLYTDLFLLSSKHYKPKQDIFKFETYLDSLHFTHFYKLIKSRFHFAPRELNVILNTRLNISNLIATLRLKEIYKSNWDEAQELLYKHSGTLSVQFIKEIYNLPARSDFINALPSPYKGLLKDKHDEDISHIELLLNEYFYTVINKLFYTTDNCLVRTLCFVFIKRFETKNLISISEGRRLKADRDDILKSLIPPLY